MIHAASAELVVSGSGDGLVDAVAAGLATGAAAVRYSAHVADIGPVLEGSVGLVVTDSNRDRARHWRSSQDTTGYTEPGGAAQDVLRPSASDARLDVFDTSEPETQTIALQRGPVAATATSYGEPFAYLPEHRPFMSIDGDPATAWLVGEHGDPVGETLRLEFDEPVDRLLLHQSATAGRRRISRIATEISSPSGVQAGFHRLDESSWNGTGQELRFEVTIDRIDITIDAVEGGTPFTGSAVAAVGFSEIDAGSGPAVEVVRPPHDALAELPADTPLAVTFTRLRTDPMDRWRDDPEPVMVREFDIPSGRRFDVGLTLRVDARAPDAALADLFGWPVVATTRLTGSPRHAGVAAFDDDSETAWITGFGAADGATVSASTEQPVASFEMHQPVTGFSRVTHMTVRSGTEERRVELVPDAAGRSVGVVEPPLPPGDVTFTIDGLDATTTVDRRFGDPVTLPASITELRFDGRPTVPRLGTTTTAIECTPVMSIDGQPVTASVEIAGDAWLDGAALTSEACASEVSLDTGTHELVAATGLPITLDQVTLDDGVRDSLSAVTPPPTVTLLDQGRFDRAIRLDGCSGGCWLIVGEGHNEAWSASVGGESLGDPTPVDGGFNGWWVPPSEGPIVVDVAWTAQRGLTVALLLTGLGAIAALVLLVRDRRSGPPMPGDSVPGPRWSTPVDRLPDRAAWATALLWPGLAALLIRPEWALWGLLGGLAVVATRRRRLPELAALASLSVVAALVVVRERRIAPFPNGAWPSTFESLHGLGMFAIVCVLVGALVATDADAPPGAVSTPGADDDVRDDVRDDEACDDAPPETAAGAGTPADG